MFETEYISPKKQKITVENHWSPMVGQETDNLLDYFQRDKGLDEDSCKLLRNESIRVLSRCVNPSVSESSNTGLVYGYVQSGKTMSYTTLAVLAKDNNYQIIILIAGTTTNLLEQTVKRLKKDLRLGSRSDRAWKFFENPEKKELKKIQGEIDFWEDDKFNVKIRKTILIVVLKNKTRLEKLVDLIKLLKLQKSPVLIIDDEGDQASLNTKARENVQLGENEASAIYAEITELKKSIPHHTFLQYTATPQAPLFINQLDRLSPNFIELLTPGTNYVGVKEFFQNHTELIYDIPSNEIYNDKDRRLESPPESLLESLRLFILCVILGYRDCIKSDNLSMMVHPSHKTNKHNIYYTWVSNIVKMWEGFFESGFDDEREVLLNDFKRSYARLEATAPNIPEFSELEIKEFITALKITDIHELNSKTKVNTVDWYNNFSNILVGGQVMDRGFTVEGLIVTYMPRGVGVGNVDTIQQRARFFGYKKKYLPFCRIFLDIESRNAYEIYAKHEEYMRAKLEEFRESGRPLDEWVRMVRLDMYNLTRPNVLSGKQKRYSFKGDWFTIKAPHDSLEIIEHNRNIITDFLRRRIFNDDQGHENRTDMQKHKVLDFYLNELFEQLFTQLRFTRESDSHNFTLALSLIRDYLDKDENAICTLYLMSGGKPRDRSLSKNNNVIEQLFQGRNPKSGAIVYPGDDKIKCDNKVTLQIHLLNLKDKETGNTLYREVFTIALWLPDGIGGNLVGVEHE